MDNGRDEQAAGVGQDMALASLDEFARVKAAWTAAFRGLDALVPSEAEGWLSMIPALGEASRPCRSRAAKSPA